MAQLSHVSDSQALVQSMLQKLRLQEQRSDQASTTSEDLSSRVLEDVLDDGGSAAGETLTGAAGDNPRSPRTKWPVFRKAFTKTSDLSKVSTRKKDSLSFSDVEEVPRWERKQLVFALVADRIAERKNGLVDQEQGQLQPPLNHENHTSPTGGTTDSPGFSGEPATPLTPGCVTQVMTARDCPRQDSLTTDDNVSFTDSLGRNGQAVSVDVVTEKTTDNVRKNKRKWAETKTKRFTQKIKDKWRDRNLSAERRNGKNGEKHTTDEQVPSDARRVVQENVVLPSAVAEAESEVTLSAQGYDSLSLGAFDMGFGTSLMEEIFTAPEWTKFLALSDGPQVIPEDADGRLSTYLTEGKQCEMIQAQITPAVFDSEAMLTDTDTASDSTGAMTHVGQVVYSESGEDGVSQLTSSEEVSHDQLWTDEMNSADQTGSSEPNANESQSTTEDLEQSNVHDMCHDLSESNTGDIKDQTQTDPDLSQTCTSDVNPYQTDITAPTPEETTASEINPHQEVLATSDTLDPPDTSDMVNPYLETQTDDMSEPEDVNPYLPSQTGPTSNSDVGDGEENAPQLLPLLDLSYLKAEEEGNSSEHDRRRRALHSEERETFIDEDDDDDDDADPPKSLSSQKTPLSPPPFPPPLPPQRSISVDSDSSSSLEIVPKKRRLDSAPRRVRFAEEVVILPAYIQPDVEDWPEEEEDEEEMEDPEDMDDREDMEEMTLPEDIRAMESPREAQPSLYNWILGITKKTKRKA